MFTANTNHRKPRFWLAFWDGLSGAGLYRPPVRRAHAAANDLAALRSDWQKIEEDFRAAIRAASDSRPAA